jgi:pimeloyl-ACP methyl ester carboxylesterase
MSAKTTKSGAKQLLNLVELREPPPVELVMEFEFSLKYKVPDAADIDELIEQLGEAGCDDAVIGTGQPGRIALDFIRDAPSAEKAIVSALAAVKTAIPGARLLEVTPNFVGMTELADLLGVSRQ